MDVVSPILEKAGAGYVINKLIDVATNYVRDQYYWKTDLQEELQSLRRLLPHIQAVVGFAEYRLTPYEAPDPALMEWLWQFRDVIDEAEEVMDELEYRELEKKANSDKNTLSTMVDASVRAAKRLLKFDDVLGRLRACVKNLNTSASDVEKFLALVTQTGSISTGQTQQEILPLSNQSRITSPLPVLSFKGREEEKGKIIQYLLGESVEESEIQMNENVHCLPLVGMGGMGKTALAQQVFDHFENVKKEQFHKRIWVCVSTDFNASSLMKKILEYSTGRSESGPLEQLPVKLKEELHSKRFLLVLDDAWNDDNRTEWEKLCAPLLYGQKGSWILLTTRSRSVAKMVSKVIRGTMEPMTLPGLSKDECRSLLYEHAFACRDPNEFPLLKEIGEEIVQKLNGVPLLAKSIGGALNSQLEAHHWTSISRSELWKTPQDSKCEFIPVLTLSYVMLSPRLKRCFSYCGIFPQDYQFDKQKLVGMWVAAGLVYSDGSEEGSDEVIANYCFDMLCNKSFFDLHTYNRRPFWERGSFYDTEREDFYTMHDMLNGLALHVSRYECYRIVDVPPSSNLDYNAIRHISISIISPDAQLHDLAKMVCKFKHLRTLWINYYGHHQKLDDFIRDACKPPRRIRVLIIESRQCLESISDFVKLRFLDISGLWEPPPLSLSKSICKFYFLQVLIGSGDYSILATDANKMTNLRHLYGVRGNALLSVAEVGKLTSLQELYFSVGTEPGYRIDELMNITNLHQLSIAKLSNVRSLEEANKVNLVSKSFLTRLGLGWNGVSSNLDLDQQVLAALRPPKIRELSITHYKGRRPASWMDTPSLSQLEFLRLDSCTSWEELPPLWKLPCLKFLRLYDMKAIRSLGCHCSDRIDIQFPVLEKLQFCDLPLWEEWNCADDYIWFPHLKSLKIHQCPKLKKIPDLPLSIEDLDLQNLGLIALPQSYRCSNGSRTFGRFQQLMSLESLRIYNCPMIVQIGSIGEEDDNLLPSSLKKLQIRGFPAKHEDLASYLRGLTSLADLSLHCSPGMESLPLASELEHLTALRHLSISDGEALTSPGGLYIIKSLKSLRIYDCPKFLSAEVEFLKDKTRKHASILPFSLVSLQLENSDISQESLGRCLQGLTSLEGLKVSGCRNLVSLPNIEYLRDLTALRTLNISDCQELRELESLTALVSLEKLEVSGCRNLVSLPNIEYLRNLTALRTLNISGCEELRELESLTLLVSLEELAVSGCRNLVSLPNIEYLTALRSLHIFSCEELLVSLRKLDIQRCPKLLAAACSTLQNPATTTEQSATKIKKGTLPSLDEIQVDNIFYLPILPISERLKTLCIFNNTKNSRVPLDFICFPSEIEWLLLQCQESLESLTLQSMPHLQSLPASLESFSSLKYFVISSVPKLKSLPRMPASLEELGIYGCSAKLKKRCQKNIGPDWPNINHIPRIYIQADEEDKTEDGVNCNWVSTRLWSSR